MKSGKKIEREGIYALAFGLFLGLCIWKFGNPVILDNKITPPNSLSNFGAISWPTHWANWILSPARNCRRNSARRKKIPLAANKMALAAAAALVRLAVVFRDANG